MAQFSVKIMRLTGSVLGENQHVDRPALARETSALTHGHLAGQEAAAAFVTILETYSETGNLGRAVHRAVEGCRCPETRAAMHRALTARRDGLPETVEGLGGG